MVVHVLQDMTAVFGNLSHGSDILQNLVSWHSSHDWTVLAQQFNQDILGEMQKGFNNFVKTGQVWALIIGVVLGYLIRSLTAY